MDDVQDLIETATDREQVAMLFDLMQRLLKITEDLQARVIRLELSQMKNTPTI